MLRSLLKHALPRGLRIALRNTINEIDIWRRHRRGCRQSALYSGRKGLRLNLGRGPNHKTGWVNIDLSGKTDLTLDLREVLPLARCSKKCSE
jgi:hypothetical protein